MKKMIFDKLPAALFFLVLTGLFEIIVQGGIIPDWLLPAPSQVLRVFNEMPEDFFKATSQTVIVSIKGLALSFFIGNILAVLLSLSEWIESAINPIAIFFQTVPVIAIAPLLVIWFGFGEGAVLASSLVVSFFPILANTMTGLKNTPSEYLELAKLYKVTKIQTLIRLRIPFSLIHVISGLKIAGGLSIIGTIVGEFVAGGGIGGLIDSARTQQRVDIVFGALVLSSLYGIILLSMLNYLEARILNWRPFYDRGKK